jgi:hypothetical protein
MNQFPQQANGLPGFVGGNYACWGAPNYPGPGSDQTLDNLNIQCPYIQQDIPLCQKLGKKILLSLGGAATTTSNYQLTTHQAGIDFAEFLWGAYGPYNSTWVGLSPYNVRPWDRGFSNADTSTDYQIDIDGFDLDIERAPTGKCESILYILSLICVRWFGWLYCFGEPSPVSHGKRQPDQEIYHIRSTSMLPQSQHWIGAEHWSVDPGSQV